MARSRNLGSIFAFLELRTEKWEKQMADVQKNFRKFGRQAKSIGSDLTRNVTLPLAAIGGASVKAFADFDSSMTQSLAIMGNVSDAMQNKMAGAARKMALESTFAADEVAKGYFFLASAGLDAEQSIAALPQVTRFAQAGMFDLAMATDLATDAQSALGLTVKDPAQNLQNLTRITDVLAKANTAANATIQQFSESLTNQAGAGLRLVNKDIEEGVAVLAAYADQGVKGAAAGTALSIVMRDLQTKALGNKEAFEQAGVAVFDSNGKFRNMADVISDLENKLDGMSDAQKKATLLQLGFSDKSVAFIQQLIGMSDKIRNYEKELRKAGGTTKEIADKQLESFSSKLKLLSNNLNEVGIIIGGKLAPFLESLAGKVAGVAEWFGKLDPKTQEAIIAFGAIAATVGPLVFTFGALATVLGGAVLLKVGAVTAAVGAAAAAWVAWGEDIKEWYSSTIEALDGVLDKLGNFGKNTVLNSLNLFQPGLGNSFVYATGKVKDFNAEIAKSRARTDAMLKDALAPLGELERQLDKQAQGEQLKVWKQNIDKVVESMGGMDKAKEKVKTLGESIKEAASKALGLAVQAKKTEKETNNLSNSLGGNDSKALAKATDKAADAFESLQGRVRDAGREFEKQQLRDKIDEALTGGTTDALNAALSDYRNKLIQIAQETFVEQGGALTEAAKANIDKLTEYEWQKTKTEIIDRKREEDIQSTRESVDFWRGMMEDAITDTRFDWEEQFKKAGVGIASDFLGSFGGITDVIRGKFENIGKDISAVFTKALEGGFSSFGEGLEAAGAAGFPAAVAASVFKAFDAVKNISQGEKGGLNSFWQTALALPTGGLSFLSEDIGSIFGGGGDAQTDARRAIEGFLDNAFSEDIIFGARDRFEGPWVESFHKIAGDGVGAFSALGLAITQMTGQSAELGPQIGFLIAEHVGGSLDDARVKVQELGLDFESMAALIDQAAEQGAITWHEAEVQMQNLNKVTGEGLVAVGDLEGAYGRLLTTGGRGIPALNSLKNLAIESLEIGANTIEEFQKAATQLGISQEEVDRLATVLEGRGVNSMEDLKGASNRLLGSIIADLESSGIEWKDQVDKIDDVQTAIDNLDTKISGLDQTIDLKVRINYETVNSPPSVGGDIIESRLGNIFNNGIEKFANGGVVNSDTMFGFGNGRLGLMGEAGPEAILPLQRNARNQLGVNAMGAGGVNLNYTINATNATPGVVDLIAEAVKEGSRSTVKQVFQIMNDRQSRGAM